MVKMLRRKLLKKMFWAFKYGVKSIQTAGYNGARTVYELYISYGSPNKLAIKEKIINKYVHTVKNQIFRAS